MDRVYRGRKLGKYGRSPSLFNQSRPDFHRFFTDDKRRDVRGNWWKGRKTFNLPENQSENHLLAFPRSSVRVATKPTRIPIFSSQLSVLSLLQVQFRVLIGIPLQFPPNLGTPHSLTHSLAGLFPAPNNEVRSILQSWSSTSPHYPNLMALSAFPFSLHPDFPSFRFLAFPFRLISLVPWLFTLLSQNPKSARILLNFKIRSRTDGAKWKQNESKCEFPMSEKSHGSASHIEL